MTPSHNLLTIICLTLHLFTKTFTLKENLCIYTLVLFIYQVELPLIQKTYLRVTKSPESPGEDQYKGDQYPLWYSPRGFYVTVEQN